MGEVKELKAKSETRKAFDVIAQNRMDCYQAHIDAGFDHEGAMIFVQMDTDMRCEDEEYYELELED